MGRDRGLERWYLSFSLRILRSALSHPKMNLEWAPPGDVHSLMLREY
jgi:hypothetical protein